ncbi:hypothetical protein D9M71_256390 [compost metagenome]
MLKASGSARFTATFLFTWVSKSTRKMFTVPEVSEPRLALSVLNTEANCVLASAIDLSLILPELSTMKAML